tara:strand:- start:2186 stop:3190 length:1005 start_codon:yes stop_codon:yes gene_type:complete
MDGKSYNQLVVEQFKKNKLAHYAFYVLIGFFVIAIFADFLANDKPLLCSYNGNISSPVIKEYFVDMGLVKWEEEFLNIEWKDLEYDFSIWPLVPFLPSNIDFMSRFAPPGKNNHFLGTDQLGRDVLSGIIHGFRTSLIIGFVVMSIASIIGITLGALAGYYGGWVDIIIQRLIELMLTMPTFFLILTIVAFYPGGGIWVIMIVIGLTSWTGIARYTRGEFLKTRNLDFVSASVAMGNSELRTIFRHILPNSIAPVLVAVAFGIASAILTESSMAFLGITPANSFTWGTILAVARGATYAWWLALFPGLAIFITVTVYNLVGEGLRDALDPRLKQ